MDTGAKVAKHKINDAKGFPMLKYQIYTVTHA